MTDTPESLLRAHIARGAADPGSAGELLGPLLDFLGCLVIALDRDARIVVFNRACELVTGFGIDDVRGEPLWERLLPGEEIEPVEREIRRLLGAGGHDEFEHRLACRDGSTVLVHWRNTVLRDSAGGATHVISTGIDLTERSRLQHALDDGAARLHAILDSAVDAIVTIDELGVIESANPAAERLFGYPRAYLIGRNVSMLMPEPYRSEHDRYLARYLETGDARVIGIGREVQGRRRDGALFPVELSVSEFTVTGRRRFTGIVRDISDRRRAEAQARVRLQETAHAGRLLELGEMLSGLAHEVNQPLTAIVSFAEACLRMIRAGSSSPEVIEEALRQIAEQGQRAGEIIHRLRRLGRKGDPTRAPFDLNASIHEVLALVDHAVRRNEVHVVTSLAPDLPETVGDPVLVEQVLLNLVRNAIYALGDVGDRPRDLQIVSSHHDGSVVRVRVADTGRGLPAGDAERCFETFFTTKPHGVGIGLSLSRSIIEAHGGRLTAAPREGGGAEFTFELPVSAGEAA